MATQNGSPPERKRVKVYELKDNDWYDRGTGYSTTHNIYEESRILIESEEFPDRTLLEVEIRKEDVYQKQQETLIVWTDNEGIDMALSYQEAEGAASVWEAINTVQQRLGDDSDDLPLSPLTLPSPDLSSILQIEDEMRRANQSQIGRDTMVKMILADDYVAKLIPLVQMAEDLEDIHDLHRLCNIMKTLILYNDNGLIEHIVTDDIILGVVGALEYDPDFPHYKANHRQYLADSSKFKEVVPIQDQDVRKKIHFTYRLQYLKDVVLARVLDDPTFSVLNSLIFFNQVDIVNHLQSNQEYMKQIFALLNSSDAPTQKKKDAVLLIQQSCAIAKNLQPPGRAQLYHNLINNGLFQTITFALKHQDAAVRVAGTDILVAVIDQDPLMVRTQISKALQDKHKPMTETLIELLLVETDVGVKAQIADAIKVLLDPNTNVASPAERPMGGDSNFMSKYRGNLQSAAQSEGFLETFYSQSADLLFQPLRDLERRTDLSNLNSNEVTTFTHLVEILCFFLRQHSYRSKYYILGKGFHSRVSQLLCCPQKHLKLSAIKYFRAVIATGDEYHIRNLISLHLLAPLLRVITSTMPRDNLLNSAALELFEFIRRGDAIFAKQLIFHLAEHYREVLSSIAYVDTFQHILARYEVLRSPPADLSAPADGPDDSFVTSEADTPGGTSSANPTGARQTASSNRWSAIREDADQEAYFDTSESEDDDDDELARAPQTLPTDAPTSAPNQIPEKPLVDYADDDSDPDSDRAPTLSSAPVASPDGDADSAPPSTGLTTPPTDATPPSTSPSPSNATLPLPPKRAREDDDDEDVLARLAPGSAKRRNSGLAARVPRSPTTAAGAEPLTQADEDVQTAAKVADVADSVAEKAEHVSGASKVATRSSTRGKAVNGHLAGPESKNGASAATGKEGEPPDEMGDESDKDKDKEKEKEKSRRISIAVGAEDKA